MKQFKHTLTSILLFCLVVFSALQASAQAPTITKTIGYPIGANVSCYGIAYGASKYAAIAYNGDVYTSADGDNWSKSASLGQSLYNITFGNSLFVVCGANGYIATSTDAITWTQRATGTTNTLNDVQYLQNVFYAVGQNRTILSSVNGTTWSAVTVSSGTATDFLFQIVYGGGKYIIIGSAGPSGPITYQSTTGASSSWSTVGGFGVFGNTGLNKIAYLNSQFILITSSTAIFTSSNGATWSNITGSMTVTNPNSTTAAVGNGNYFNSIYYNAGTYYWVGYSTYNAGQYGAIFTSPNLTALTLQANPLNIVANKSYYLNGKHFIAGNEGFATSTNGTNYTFPYGSFNSVAFNGTTYVGVGAASTLSGAVFSSTTFNSNNWVNRGLQGQRPLYGVVYDGSKFVAVGDKTVISSTDGNTWSSLATPTDVFACLAYGGSKYVVGGYAPDYSSYFLKYSSNGITWTTANSAGVTYFKVRYLNGAFFAVGIDNNYPASSGIIMRSTDGVSWTNVTPTGLAFNVYCFNDVTWDGTKYHFIGADDSYNLITLSTATPTTTSSYANKGTINNVPGGVSLGSSYGEGCISYSNGKYVGAVVDNSSYQAYLIYSTNGTSWTSVATNDKSVVYDAIVDNGVFRMVGTGDEKISVAFAAPNTAPTFSNATTTLSVCQNASATSINSLLQITDADAGQTETFSVTGNPGHGSITAGTTVASGTNVSPTGWSYTPANGYSGNDAFTIQVSDGNGGTASKIINVTVNSFTSSTNNQTICSSALPYTWDGLTFTIAGAQTKTGLTNAKGCDSSAVYNLTVNSTTSSTTNIAICPSALPYTWNGLTFTGAGSQTYHTSNAKGCDSAATLNLTVKANSTSDTTTAICNSFTWHDSTYKASGDYVWHTTNAAGCDSARTLHLTILFVTSTTSKTDAACFGSPTGSITVTPTFGLSPYTYRIGTLSAYGNDNNFTNLKAGNYRISILDALGCAGITDQVVISQLPQVTGTTTATDAICNATYTGSITVNPTNGTSPYTYRLGTTGSFVTGNTFNGVKAGTYKIFIQDAGGCVGPVSATINQPPAVTATAAVTDVTGCKGGSNGTITVTPTSGSGPYAYKIGATGSYSPFNSFTGIKAGTYSVYVQDATGCEGAVIAVVGQPTAVSATFTKVDESCPNAKNGAVTVNVTGGTAPYTYRFGSVGAFTSNNTFSNLKAGSYRIYVNDANGCTGYSVLVTIAQTNASCPITFSARGIANASVSEMLNLSPNPSNSQFKLILPSSEKAATVRVLDVNGKTLYTTKTASQSIIFGQDFAPGVYLVEVRQGETVKTLKAIKIRN